MMEGPMQAAFEKAELWRAKKPEPAKACRKGYRKERYSAEFKQRAVERVKELGSVVLAAKELDLHPPTVHSWVYIVEHGGKLEPSKGWVPENGDRYLNPNPGHGSATPGSNDRERADLSPEVVTTIYERGRRMHEVKYEGEPSLVIGSGSLTGGYAAGDDIMKEAEKQREQTKPFPSGFPLEGQVPGPHAVEVRKLRAENEALRQIIRGYQSLLNLM